MRKRKPVSYSQPNNRGLTSVAALISGLVLCIVFLGLLAPHTAHADSQVWPTGYWGPLLSCTGNYGEITPVGAEGVAETCNDFCDIMHTGQNIIDFAMTVVIFVGAPIMIAAGGILLMVGNPLTGEKESKRSQAKSMIVSAVIGVGIALGAWVILSTFLWLVGNGPGSKIEVSWPNIECEIPPLETDS
jgi:hypothetical protein